MIPADDDQQERRDQRDQRLRGYPPRRRRRNRGYYGRQASAIYDLQMREAVIRWTQEGVSDADIATRLGQSPGTIKRYRDLAVRRSIQRAAALEAYGPLPDPHTPADPPPPT